MLDPQTLKPDDIITLMDAAEYLECNPQVLRRAAREGRIPFASRISVGWVVEARGLKFLVKYYSTKARQSRIGLTHHQQSSTKARLKRAKQDRLKLLKLAAKLDPACRARQKQFQPQYYAADNKS